MSEEPKKSRVGEWSFHGPRCYMCQAPYLREDGKTVVFLKADGAEPRIATLCPKCQRTVCRCERCAWFGSGSAYADAETCYFDRPRAVLVRKRDRCSRWTQLAPIDEVWLKTVIRL